MYSLPVSTKLHTSWHAVIALTGLNGSTSRLVRSKVTDVQNGDEDVVGPHYFPASLRSFA